MAWKVKKMCDNCPFRTDGNQIRIEPERLEDIKEGQRLGQPFYCHKTVDYGRDEEDERDELGRYIRTGDELECAGALAFRQTLAPDDITAAFQRLLERVNSGS